jgi:hypothetical protein
MEQFVALPPQMRERMAVAAILGHDVIDARPPVPEIIQQHFADLTSHYDTLESTNAPIPAISVFSSTDHLPDA